ncbi:MAG: OmpA family protein [Candidatus Eisenbacteria bacterium]|uniref:OmpA family protein n=1 Tax=Eiseniibacteriota bacterium TaxID=2212470 RepID=A0A849SPJ1_UNCEI|nr:OmpA family protein [Candidatus Eisenbacteria bacterium]
MNKDREIPVRIIIKKRGHAGGHHGGAWKVAFADFMTAMFALFLVLWLVNQSSDVKSAIAGYFQDPLGRADEFGSSILPGEGAQAAQVRPLSPADVIDLRRNRLTRLSEELKHELEGVPELTEVMKNVEITLTNDGLQIELLEDSIGVFFETGVPTPSARGQKAIAVLGEQLGKLPNPLRIEGHTDARPYSRSGPYGNWELSADRANAARRILTSNGVPAARIAEVRGLADRQPRDPEHPFAARNRRISILVMLGEPVVGEGELTDLAAGDSAVDAPATDVAGNRVAGASQAVTIRPIPAGALRAAAERAAANREAARAAAERARLEAPSAPDSGGHLP